MVDKKKSKSCSWNTPLGCPKVLVGCTSAVVYTSTHNGQKGLENLSVINEKLCSPSNQIWMNILVQKKQVCWKWKSKLTSKSKMNETPTFFLAVVAQIYLKIVRQFTSSWRYWSNDKINPSTSVNLNLSLTIWLSILFSVKSRKFYKWEQIWSYNPPACCQHLNFGLSWPG